MLRRSASPGPDGGVHSPRASAPGLSGLFPSASRVFDTRSSPSVPAPDGNSRALQGSQLLRSQVNPSANFSAPACPPSLLPLHKYLFNISESGEGRTKPGGSRTTPAPPAISRTICLSPRGPSWKPLSGPLDFRMSVRTGFSRALGSQPLAKSSGIYCCSLMAYA